MNENMDLILSKLNTISRMAIIENAPNTEKMLITFTKVLKYRYQIENPMVIAETEIKLAEVLCECYNILIPNMTDFVYEDQSKCLGVVFVPHFSLLSYYYCVMNVLLTREQKVHVKISTRVTVEADGTQILIIFIGNTDMQAVYKEAYVFIQDEYISLKQAIARLKVSGLSDISIYYENNSIEVKIKIK